MEYVLDSYIKEFSNMCVNSSVYNRTFVLKIKLY
jgi:hypothetical protein